jgi:hypothetical protein
MIRCGLLWSLGATLGLLATGCFEDTKGPAEATEGSTGRGSADSGSTGGGPGGTDVDPDGTTTTDPGSGSFDGAAECASSEVCVDLAPDGWDGPVAYFEGPDLAALPSCAAPFGGLAVELFDELTADPAVCTACSCGGAGGVECSSPTVRFYESSNCFGGFSSDFDLGAADECIVFPNGTGAYGAESDPVTPVAGTGECPAAGGDAMLGEPAWGVQLRACEAPPATVACGDGQVCVPTPGAPFAPGLCVHRPGDVACPAGPYDQRRLRYAGVDDGRGCSDCDCGDPFGGSCTAEILLSYTSTCTDDYLHLINPGSGGCTTLFGETPNSGMLLVDGVDGAECMPTPEGGQAEGEALPSEPVTFCCTG